MLFIGYFSLDHIDADGKQGHGYLSCLVEADSPDHAIEKFETHIRKMGRTTKEMMGVVHVYIEEILQFSEIPKTPIVTRLQFSEGVFPASTSHTVAGIDDACVDAFGYAPDVDNQETCDEEGHMTAEPFITFRQ